MDNRRIEYQLQLDTLLSNEFPTKVGTPKHR